MYSYISLIFLLSVVAVAIVNADISEKCRDVSPRIKQCCQSEMFMNEPPAEMKECHDLYKPPPSCDFDICLAKKLGVMSDDGKVNKNMLADSITKIYGLDSATNDAFVKNCVNGDISKYGKEDFCDLLKIRMCADLQLVKNCPKWSNEGECEGAQDDLTECLNAFQ